MSASAGLLSAGFGFMALGGITAIGGLMYGEQSLTAHGVTRSQISCGTIGSPNRSAYAVDSGTQQLEFGHVAPNPCTPLLDHHKTVHEVVLAVGGGVAVLSLVGLVIPGFVVREREPQSHRPAQSTP